MSGFTRQVYDNYNRSVQSGIASFFAMKPSEKIHKSHQFPNVGQPQPLNIPHDDRPIKSTMSSKNMILFFDMIINSRCCN